MQRRQYLTAVGAATAGTALFGRRASAGTSATLDTLGFYSTTSVLDTNGEPLTDGRFVPVRTEGTTSVIDADGDGDAVEYPNDEGVPLVAADGSVVGFGSMFATDQADFEADNEEFLLNVWDDTFGSGTVLWDEGHDQYYTRSEFSRFVGYAEDNGYTVEVTTDLRSDLDGAAGVVVTTPADGFTDDERAALASFVSSGGGVVIHSQSDYGSHDETDALNAICESLGVGFRFNDAEVTVDGDYGFVSSNFNTEAFPSYFVARPGLGVPRLSKGDSYGVDVVSVADGDTVDVRFDNGAVETVRLLGVDTPELPSHPSAERGVEWPGLAYDAEPTVDSVTFYSSSSLLLDAHDHAHDGHGHHAHGGRGRGHGHDTGVAVAAWAEDTATLADADGDGDATTGDGATDATGRIPLVAVEGSVVGFAAMLVADGTEFADGTDEFVLDIWDDQLGGSGTVLWATGHDQYYTPDRFGEFVGHLESVGYSVVASDDLAGDLGGGDASAVVLTTPGSVVPDADKRALEAFVENDGSLFVHDQSDYDGYDATSELNAVMESLGRGIRFNDAELVDETNNAGSRYAPTTTNLNDALPVTEGRRGVDGDLPVTYPFLGTWGENAGTFASDELAGKSVTLTLDENEPVRGNYGRILGYITYDATGDGAHETLYNLALLERGFARVYDSGLTRHDEFAAAEVAARRAGTGLWAASDRSAAPAFRDRRVSEVYVPKAVEVLDDDTDHNHDHGRGHGHRQGGGRKRGHGQKGGRGREGDHGHEGGHGHDPHTVVRAAETASKPRAALARFDPAANVALVGGLLADESYEAWEGADTSVSGFEDFTLLATLIDAAGGPDTARGLTVVEGGHGQFESSSALSAEDAAYFGRFLEGIGGELRGLNTLTTGLGAADTLVITPPTSDYTPEEAAAVRRFARGGGAVILMGASDASAGALGRTNALAETIGTDLRFGGPVTDDETNLAGDSTVPRTTAFGANDRFLAAYDANTPGYHGHD